MKLICSLVFILIADFSFGQGNVISGYVKEKNTNESIPNASVSLKNTKIGTQSNNYGYFALDIKDITDAILVFSATGYAPLEFAINTATFKDEILVNLDIEQKLLDEVIVSAAKQPIEAYQMGLVKLPIQQIKKIPALLGEKDVIKALQLLPGVQKGTEGSTALYVRGGGPDQNLIILDDAQVYNANHLFGFFSVFNGDAIKNVDFWKGSFPARFGGRLSSVVDMQMKEGNREKLHGEGGIGILSSRIMLEGPIKKDNSSFMFSARRSYVDVLTKPFMSKNKKDLYRFYDVNTKLNFDVNSKNKIYLSGYFGNDRLISVTRQVDLNAELRSESGLDWGNATASIRYNHLYSKKLFSNITLTFTDFKFGFDDNFLKTNEFNTSNTYSAINSSIRDYSIKTDFDYFYSQKHTFKSGFAITEHNFLPRATQYENKEIKEIQSSSQKFKNLEYGLYLEDIFTKNRFSYNIGLRINGINSEQKNYVFIEPRLTTSISLPNYLNLKIGYARNNQFVHLLSSTGTGLSTDLWVPTTAKTPPQQSDQFSIGITKDFKSRNIVLTIESYRKYMRNIIAYREGATFIALSNNGNDFKWEDNVTIGKGESYGTELLIQKNNGKFTGWIGYTLSWTIHQFDELNNGQKFYPKYDRRHDVSIVGIYNLSKKTLLSATWIYATGNRLTVPNARYYSNFSLNEQRYFGISQVDYLGSRNSFKAEDYHRLDLAIQFQKQKKRFQRTWEIGLFNAYFRKNPYYYYIKAVNDFQEKGQRLSLEKKYLFPIIPSVTYNFKF